MRRRLLLLLLVVAPLFGDDVTRLQILVTNDLGHPVDRASVIVKFAERSVKKFGAKVRTEWNTKTSQEGLVRVPGIPKGKILIQVIAKNYQTFGQVYDIQDDEKTIEIKLNPPQGQYSAH
jgi:hypothetical protein